ncbi:MAG TPA: hypothetical protein VG796_07105 [Verrucomicrobiales bacterium]|nr:hypothetical protein [Verrucomicrobiales bacterium]
METIMPEAQALTPEEELTIEADLLTLGIVSLDGLDGMDYKRARAVAQHSAALALEHYEDAIATGLI